MRTLELPGTGLRTTALGFGCAHLFRQPGGVDRRLLLEAAYDAGVRHFDVAPMYGLGIAEKELGNFARSRRNDVILASKFGIAPTRLARGLGHVQGPARRLLAASPGLHERLKTRAPGPGGTGSLLYTTTGYDAASARAGLETSLRALRTDYLDLLLLHDPQPAAVRAEDLWTYMEDAQAAGLIRSWGVAGEPRASREVANLRAGGVPVTQVREDIFLRLADLATAERPRALITFGILGRALALIVRLVGASARRRDRWVAELGLEHCDSKGIARLLLEDALQANPSGVVLFSSVSADRIRTATEVATSEHRHPSGLHAVFLRLVDELRSVETAQEGGW